MFFDFEVEIYYDLLKSDQILLQCTCQGRVRQFTQLRRYTVHKKDLILRSIEHRSQMQFIMAHTFPLWRLRRYSVKHSQMSNFMFDASLPEKTEEHGLGANQHSLDLYVPVPYILHLTDLCPFS